MGKYFNVEYEKIKSTFKVNDNIKVTGLAKAYAGNNIDGAQIKFRVVRVPRFIYHWMFYRSWQPPSAQMEIVHGETNTDKNGKFIIEFEAIPDKTIDKKFEPVSTNDFTSIDFKFKSIGFDKVIFV